MAELIKVNDTTIVRVGTEEVRQVFGKTQIVERVKKLTEQLDEAKEMLALFG